MSSPHAPLEIVNRFFALTEPKGRPIPDLLPGIRDMLTEDFVFIGPLMKTEGREPYVGLLGQFLQAHVGYRFHRQFVAGDDICSIYDMTVRTPAGGTLTLTLADWLTLRDGRICQQQLYYDPRAFATAFGLG